MTAKRKRGRPPTKYVVGQNENGEPQYATLSELGISRTEAFRCRMLAAIPRDIFEELLERPGRPPSTTELVELGRYFDGKDGGHDRRFKIKPDDPADAAWQIARRCTDGYMEELIAFLQEYIDMARRRDSA